MTRGFYVNNNKKYSETRDMSTVPKWVS